ncbi:MAG: fluoride efflux transporter CrcB [Blastocatellales bacterium]
MLKIILVLLGGAVGTGGRYLVSLLVYSLVERPNFPYATLIVNITGSFAIGFLSYLFDAKNVAAELRAALLVGVLGGYTTFSSFSMETLNLIRDGGWGPGLLYSVGSLIAGLIAVALGAKLAQALFL